MVAAAAPPVVSPPAVAVVPVPAWAGVELVAPVGAWLDGPLAPEEEGVVLDTGFGLDDVVGVGAVEPQFWNGSTYCWSPAELHP